MASRGGRRLVGWAIVYGVTHHLGLLPGGLGDAGGGTRWVDWLDLLVPFLVVGSALAALAAADTDRHGWVAAVAGSVFYVQGHGVHLAANSIANARGDDAPAHLWDETVGHLLWYGGLALLVAVLARAFATGGLRVGRLSGGLAVLTGATWATNTLGADGLMIPGLAAAFALSAYGWRMRGTGAGQLLMVAFVPSAVGLSIALIAA